jgi:hypothetical protein
VSVGSTACRNADAAIALRTPLALCKLPNIRKVLRHQHFALEIGMQSEKSQAEVIEEVKRKG